ncbi:hypothetical protein FRB90_012138 [Tulasnella sp. 427]|nr:hypothetical protein FRB90_012138 [Tulasnella sp. 427]
MEQESSSSDALPSSSNDSISTTTTSIPAASSGSPDTKPSPPTHRDFMTYEFCFDAFNGPLTPCNDPRALYILLTRTSVWGREPTVVTRRDGEVVGEIRPRALWKKQKVKINGVECSDLVRKGKDGKGDGGCWWFEDRTGRAFYWKDLLCCDENGSVVAKYTRQIDRPVDVSNEDKARLSVDTAFTAPSTLDYILFTALRMESKRRDTERAFGRQPQMKRDRPRQGRQRPNSSTLPKATDIEGHAHAPRKRSVSY